MTSESDNFERMVHRVHRLLESHGTEIEWNERIPDPDNPEQSRQIDVLIRKPGYLFVVECRKHRAKQDVNWVEELYGRRLSLNANGIAGVSASGFTTTAVAKAKRFGIPLYDQSAISDQEILAWGRSVRVALYFYRYENYQVCLFFKREDLQHIEPSRIGDELGTYYGFRSIFSPANELVDEQNLLIDENARKYVNFKVRFRLEGFTVQDREVVEIETAGAAYLEKLDLHIPETCVYGESPVPTDQRSIYVQQYNLGETQAVHKDGKLSLTLDLSALDVLPFWQFRYCSVSGDQENCFEIFEILAPEKIDMEVDKLTLSIAEAIEA